jgi:hypothetical protein
MAFPAELFIPYRQILIRLFLTAALKSAGN